ncbi:hypothetical protein NR798_24175 [Archangium gephyra]|uniref:hypothetical protein n=1 Tax=Archangium gephyra TaxID=48 RepID=UPI0035D3FCE6
MTVPVQTAEQTHPAAEPAASGPTASRLDNILGELRGVDVVDPAHPELLDTAAAGEVAPAHEELLGAARPGRPAPSMPRARGAQCAPAGAAVKQGEALGRAARRVRQSLRDEETPEALRSIFERCNVATYPAGALEAVVAGVADERRKAAGAVPAAVEAAGEWERMARAALASVAAAPPVVEDVPELEEPGEPLREPVLVNGIPVERIEAAAGPIAWWLERLAGLTRGTWCDLTLPCDRTIFRGRGEAERKISGVPLDRLTELLATRKASKVPAGAEVESPTWELAAYVVALVVAVAPKGATAASKLVPLAHRGSVNAARRVVRAFSGLKPRRPGR